MMHGKASINRQKSIKAIKINRALRNFSEYLYIFFLISSICMSSWVLYSKNNKIITAKNMFYDMVKVFIYGKNIVDNKLNSVEKIRIGSLKYISRNEIFEIIKKNISTGNDFISEIQKIHDEIMKIPYAKSVSIRRLPFRSLFIDIKEVEIIAQFFDRDSQKNVIIDENGKPIYQKSASNMDFPILENVLVEDLEFFFASYKVIYRCENIRGIVAKYINISRSRWEIVLKNGAKLILPSDLNEILMEKICSVGAEKLKLFDQATGIDYLDARISDRFYYKLK